MMVVSVINILTFLITADQVCVSTDHGRANDVTSMKHSNSTKSISSTRPDSTEQFLNSILQRTGVKSLNADDDIRIPGEEREGIFSSNTADANPIETVTENGLATDFLKDPQVLSNSVENIFKSIITSTKETQEAYKSDYYDSDQAIHVEKTDKSGREITVHMREARDTSRIRFVPRLSQRSSSYDISYLSELCPYANICNNKGKELPVNRASCCLACSCDSDCGIIGNCCDRREIKDFMCHPTSLKESRSKEHVTVGYLMIDKCLDTSNTDCKEMNAAPWDSLYLVYDPANNRNYYNAPCAECHGVKDLTFWHINIVCRPGQNSNGNILNTIRGKESDICNIIFTPPNSMDRQTHVCSNTLISHCNVTGAWKIYTAKVEEACARWFSPVVDRYGRIRYANIFCMICNGANYDPEEVCRDVSPSRDTGAQSITFSINYRRVMDLVNEESSNNAESVRNGVCGTDMVKHPYKPECRSVLCPNGFVKVDEKCQLISTKIQTNSYYIQLRLTPIHDHDLPSTYIKGLSEEQKSNPVVWIDTNGAEVDCFKMSFKEVNTVNGTFVEDLVVRVGKTKMNKMRLDEEIDSIKEAISKSWSIHLKEGQFEFSVSIYRYQTYTPYRGTRRYNVEDESKKSKDAPEFEQSAEEGVYEQVFGGVRDRGPIIFKKTNFCSRVRLARSEWISGFQEIRLNTSKKVFDGEKILGDSEFDIFLDDMGEPMVEICVQDFNPEYKEQQEGEAIMRKNKATGPTLSHTMPIIMILLTGCAF